MTKPYEIYFERSGGFAGLTISLAISSDKIKEREREMLDSLLQESNILNYKFLKDNSQKYPDQFQYLVQIKNDEINIDIKLNDYLINDLVKPLIKYLMLLARIY